MNKDKLRLQAFERDWERRRLRDLQLQRLTHATAFILAVVALASALAIVLGVL